MRLSPVLMGASWARLAQTATQSAPRNLFRPFVQACTSACVTMSDPLPADITHKPGCSTTANRRLVGTKVTTMVEEACGILSGDAVESGTERLLECLDRARSDAAQV